MGERAKIIINEYTALEILHRPDFDINRFYSSDYRIFIIALLKENKQLKSQLQQKENIIKEIKAQLEYLETYSSKEDVFEDMKRRLDKIGKIIDKENK